MRKPLLSLLACLAAGWPCCALETPKGPSRMAAPPVSGRSSAAGGPRAATPGMQHVPGFAAVPRPFTVPAPQSSLILFPGALPRCGTLPGPAYWQGRDILREIMLLSRRGFIPVLPTGNAPEFKGYAWFPAGWIAYGFVVPAGEKLHVRLHHPNEGWFRLAMVDRWGQLREGMLQNLIPTGNPEVSYKNPLKVANTVYVIVDDPGWMSSEGYPYTIKVDRTWDPAQVKAPELPGVMGIWAQTKAAAPEPEKPKDPKPAPTA